MYYGVLTEATVSYASESYTMDTAWQRRYTYNALFVDENGETHEIKYKTDSHNVIPVNARFSVPRKVGEKFQIKYLPYFPSVFAFYLDSPKKTGECAQWRRRIQELETQLEFYPEDKKRLAELEELTSKYDEHCR